MSTGFFAGLDEEVGARSFGSLPQSMKVPAVSSPGGVPIGQAMPRHVSGPMLSKIENIGFPPPSGFAGPPAPKRL